MRGECGFCGRDQRIAEDVERPNIDQIRYVCDYCGAKFQFSYIAAQQADNFKLDRQNTTVLQERQLSKEEVGKNPSSKPKTGKSDNFGETDNA